jgi:hypothetical protein
MRRVTARTAHEIPERAPLKITVGEEVAVGERDTEWPAFVFVTAAHGSGWVPGRYLSDVAEEGGRAAVRATVRTAYDTTELPTRAGEVLDVLAEDLPSAWLWCRSETGREGWVPCNTVTEAGAGGEAVAGGGC